MANPRKAKGTGFENRVLVEYLIPIWPDAERKAQLGINDYGDFTNVGGALFEAKNHKSWRMPEWIARVYTQIMRKHDRLDVPWAIFFKGDKRGVLFEDYVTIPARIWRQLQQDRHELMRMRREHAKWKTGPGS